MKLKSIVNNPKWEFVKNKNGKNIWKTINDSYYTEAICFNCGEKCLVSSAAYKKWDKYFCDNKCHGAYKKKHTAYETKKCVICGKEFSDLACHIKRRKCCSNECKIINLARQKLGTHPSQESIDKRLKSLAERYASGFSHPNKGGKWTDEQRVGLLKISENVKLIKNGIKICYGCRETLPLEEFKKMKGDGHFNYCKKCRTKKYNKKHDINVKAGNKICKVCKKERSESHFEPNDFYLNGLHIVCNECLDARPEQRLQQKKEYYQENKKIINEKARLRMRNNINMRIAHNIRGAIYRYVKGSNKSARTEALLGCSWDELRQHLEVQFYSEMNWDNYGSYWHIDHIAALVNFDLIKPGEQKVAFHYTNLQPLTEFDNLSKNCH